MPSSKNVPGRVTTRFRNKWAFRSIEMTPEEFEEGIQHSPDLAIYFDPVVNAEYERAGIVGFIQLQDGRFAVYLRPEW